ncbi:exodeoxyribonuclease III [Niabella defluvii]|nr:exodeoxyribonuclease III [Niabella sp. I65]
MQTDPADIICLQETKAEKDNIDCAPLMNWVITTTGFLHKKKGYSGVAVFTRIKPDNVTYGTGHQVSDDEGRVIQLDFGDIRLINAYFPSGTSGDLRQAFKYMWLDEFYMYLNELKRTHPQLIICGDYNIAHKEIDIHDPKGNKKSSGFLPEREPGWTNLLPADTMILSVLFTLKQRTSIAGGASVSRAYVLIIKAGGLTILLLPIRLKQGFRC